MVRIVGLIIVVFLVCFTYLFSRASYENQQKLPEPIRNAAYDIATVMADGVNFTNDSLGSRLRRGIRQTTSEVMIATGQAEPEMADGIMAMNTDLTGENFSARLIANSSFTRATLDKANFTKAFLDNSALDSASFIETRFNQTVMTNSSAKGADFTNASFNDADMTGSMAQGAIFSGVNFNNTLLSSTQFSGAVFTGINMSGSYGDKSIFYSANFTGANITGSDFTRANFEKAVFKEAVLTDTHFERAVLTDTDFSGADLSEATGLTQEQLFDACGDGATLLPEGLLIPNCEEVRAARAAEAARIAAEKAAAEAALLGQLEQSLEGPAGVSKLAEDSSEDTRHESQSGDTDRN